METGLHHADYISHFLMSRRMSERSRKTYSVHLRKFSAWCVANDVSFESAQNYVLARYFTELRPKHSVATVKGKYDVIRLFFSWMVDEGIRTDNPAADLRVEMPRPTDRQTLNLDQIRTIWKATKTPHERAIVGLLAINSMRPEELTRADISDLGESEGYHILHIPTRTRPYESRFTVVSREVFEQIRHDVGDRTHGPLLTTAIGERAHRRHIYRVVKVVGRRAGLPFDVSPLTLTFSMRAIAILKGFSYVSVVRGAGEIEPNRLATWLDRAPNPISDHAALRMTRLVIGSGDETLDYLMHAQALLRGPDVPPATAAAFAGAALERHLRMLLLERSPEDMVTGKTAKLGRYAARLVQLGEFNPADVQLVAKLQDLRDDAAHGWFEKITERDASWFIENARSLVLQHPTHKDHRVTSPSNSQNR